VGTAAGEQQHGRRREGDSAIGDSAAARGCAQDTDAAAFAAMPPQPQRPQRAPLKVDRRHAVRELQQQPLDTFVSPLNAWRSSPGNGCLAWRMHLLYLLPTMGFPTTWRNTSRSFDRAPYSHLGTECRDKATLFYSTPRLMVVMCAGRSVEADGM